jgi:hypothetical protein
MRMHLFHCFSPPAGYAKRGLRSAIASAAKDVVVEEVMPAPPITLPTTAAGKAADTAAAAATAAEGDEAAADSSSLVSEMQEVDKEWLSRKGKHAGAAADQLCLVIKVYVVCAGMLSQRVAVAAAMPCTPATWHASQWPQATAQTRSRSGTALHA